MSQSLKGASEFKFGDVIENDYAQRKSPRRFGYFVKTKNRGRSVYNPEQSTVIVLTDGHGTFWEVLIQGSKLRKVEDGNLPLLWDKNKRQAWL